MKKIREEFNKGKNNKTKTTNENKPIRNQILFSEDEIDEE